jgi:uncharacterized damage-inducible protein DinB
MLPDPSTSAPRLVADNLLFLSQGVELLERLDDRQYRDRPSLKLASVGGHFRHCLEVYELFLAGLPKGEVDYDARQRDHRVETDRLYARDRARIIMDELRQLPEDSGGVPMRVTMDRACEHPDLDPWSQSSVRRELQHLRSHTVHHYALIAATLRILGVEPGADFGVAPSTLAAQKS